MINVIINRNHNRPIPKPNVGFHYVDQGNYLTLDLPAPLAELSMYSDSATSCIIVVVIVSTSKGVAATLAHLDSPSCITSFFQYISELQPDGIQIYAQGANPPDNPTSKGNAAQLEAEITALGDLVQDKSLYLLEGDPRDDNRGDFSFQISSSGEASVSNQPYTLKLTDRDPTCGGQSVYCIMRRQEVPPTEIRDAGIPFTHDELVELSSIAIKFRKTASDPSTSFINIVNMESDDILNSWSTTPEYEAQWFSDQLKQGACFALSMSPVVNLSSQYLTPEITRPFVRLRKSILHE